MFVPQARRLRIPVGLMFLTTDRPALDEGGRACHSPTECQSSVGWVAQPFGDDGGPQGQAQGLD